MIPFDYPPQAHVRKHGPRGYVEPERFRPWLRDEFSFRCVYCLAREQWVNRLGGFAVEHFLPVSRSPETAADYDNLLYACSACNLAKAAHIVPDPAQALTAGAAEVREDGSIKGRTADAQAVIRTLGFDDPRFAQFRRRWITILRLALQRAPAFYQELMCYPDDLPDLSRLRPPGGNSRPEGIAQSHYAQRERGELPVVY